MILAREGLGIVTADDGQVWGAMMDNLGHGLMLLGERSGNRGMVEEAVNTLRAAVQHYLGQGRRDGAKEVQEHLERAERVLSSMPSQGV